jgi:formate dehydrogenase subunit gamma
MKTGNAKQDGEQIAALFADLVGQAGPLMPVLRRLQDRLGCVPANAIPVVAEQLNVSRAEVQGVVSFYHEFRSEPAGRHTVKICQAESCQAMGAAALTKHAVKRAGAALKQTSRDGRFTVEPVYCLGNCACSPAITIDDDLYGRVSAARFDALLDALPK